MFDDDIDWRNAASDFGLIALCREIAALSPPIGARIRTKRRAPQKQSFRLAAGATAEAARVLYP